MKRSRDARHISFAGASLDAVVSLAIRAIVGFLISFGAGFVGMIAGSLFAPSITRDDFLPLFIRIVIISLGTTLGASLAWFAFFSDRWKTGFAFFCSFAGGIVSGFLAFYWSEGSSSSGDAQIMVREITQATILGAAIGSNILPALIGAAAPRHWRN